MKRGPKPHGALTLEEVAERMGLSQRTVGKLWKSAMRKLSATPERRRMFVEHVRACRAVREPLRAGSAECNQEFVRIWSE